LTTIKSIVNFSYYYFYQNYYLIKTQKIQFQNSIDRELII